MEVNLYATGTDPVLLDTEVGGVPVQVRATPSAWSWDLGDGHVVGPTQDPGSAYPAMVNTHVHEQPGSYAITMTTTYTGEFAVAGGPWQPVDGIAQVDSPPMPYQVLTGRNRLVADPEP